MRVPPRDGRAVIPSIDWPIARLAPLWTTAVGLLSFLTLHAAATPPHFVDRTAAAGINHVQASAAQIAGLPGSAFLTGGVAAGDFDGDGWTDLVFTRLNDADLLYRNRGDGTFEARTAAAGFTAATLTNGVASGDIDNDGDLDLYITGSAGSLQNYLYLNDGDGFFTDVSSTRVAALANGAPRNGQGVSFGDFNADGYLDLAVADWNNEQAASQARLFQNVGASNPGHFVDVTQAAGLDVYRKEKSWRFSPQWADLDRDGHLDLAIASDFETSQLFWNNGDGTFTDGTLPAGVGTDYNGMGTTIADYDNDGDLDWFITNITNAPEFPGPFGGYNRLYRNDGNRQFTDATEAAGVRDARWGWGTSFFDYDNDGDWDLVATNGYNGTGWIDDRTVLWQNNDGVFTDVSTSSGIVDTQQGRGLAHLDYDRDGDLDLVIVNHLAEPILYRNDGGNDASYLRVDLQGTASNRDGINARLTLTPDLDRPSERLLWQIDGGSSFLSQSEHTAHFGLGDHQGTVDLLTIEWPGGAIQYLRDLAVDQTRMVVEASVAYEPGDIDASGSLDAADIDWLRLASDDPELFRSVYGGASLGRADLNADEAVDSADVDLLVTGLLGAVYGDLNLDQVVDQADAQLWQQGYGVLENARYEFGDIDGDRRAVGSDFLQLQQAMQPAAAAVTSAAEWPIPEPTAATLFAAGVLGACCSRLRRTRGGSAVSSVM